MYEGREKAGLRKKPLHPQHRSQQRSPSVHKSPDNPPRVMGESDAYDELRESMLSTLADDIINTPRLADRREKIHAAGVHLGERFEDDLKKLIKERWVK